MSTDALPHRTRKSLEMISDSFYIHTVLFGQAIWIGVVEGLAD